MANVNGVVYAVQVAPPSPSNWLTAGYINGRVKCNLDFYVALGTETAGTVIYMGAPLPVGAKVIRIQITASASTGSLTASVGDLNSATRYANAATGIATGNQVNFYSGCIDATNGYYVIGTNPATPTATNTDTQIILTTGGATIAVGTIIGCCVIYENFDNGWY